jgi:hypothetical protein
MNITQKIREINIVWWLLLAGVICVFACFWLIGEANKQAQYEALAPLAERIGIEPTFKALGEYIEETFTPGMPRSEVLKKLDQLGPYELHNEGPVYSLGEGVWLESARIWTSGTGPYSKLVINFFYTSDGVLLMASRESS